MPSIEAFCLLCWRFSFPVSLCDLFPEFSGNVPIISIVENHMVLYLEETFGHLLPSLDELWLLWHNHENMPAAVAGKDAKFENCWEFLDDTGCQICHPLEVQRAYYNAHKRKHLLRYQSAMAANGLYAHLFALSLIVCGWTRIVHLNRWWKFTFHGGLCLIWFVSHFNTKYSDMSW